MFRITNANGEALGYAEKVDFVKAVAPGCFKIVPEGQADGFMFQAKPYSLTDHTLDGAVCEASVTQADSGEELDRQQEKLDTTDNFVYSDQYMHWDGIKWVFSADNPIPLLRLPFAHGVPNAYYRYTDGKRYVYVAKEPGEITEDNWDDVMTPWDIEEV